jgi:hypothetical protein
MMQRGSLEVPFTLWGSVRRLAAQCDLSLTEGKGVFNRVFAVEGEYANLQVFFQSLADHNAEAEARQRAALRKITEEEFAKAKRKRKRWQRLMFWKR